MASNINPLNPTAGSATTQSVRDNFDYAKTEIEQLQSLITVSYVVLSTNTTLTNERILTAGNGISMTDAGAGNTVTIAALYTTPLSLDGSGNIYIADGALTEAKLDINNAPSADYLLKWNATAGKMEWTASTVTGHNLFSATHADTVTASPVAGDIIYANSTPAWTKLAKGTNGQVLMLVSGYPAWAAIPTSYWIDEGTYIKPYNRTDSANTVWRIYDTPSTGGLGTLLGNEGTHLDEWYGITGGDLLEIGYGSSGTPIGSQYPALYIEKRQNYSNAVTTGSQGAANFKAIRSSGNCNLTSFMSSVIRNGGYGDCEAIHAYAYSDVALGESNAVSGGSLYGIWVQTKSTAGAVVGQYNSTLLGMELDISDYHSDAGHIYYIENNAGRLRSMGVAVVAGETGSYNVTEGYVVCSASTKWHSGISIRLNSIVPTVYDATFDMINEAILIRGGDSVANDYTGIKMKDYMEYAIDLYWTTCTSGAIRFPDGTVQNTAGGGGSYWTDATTYIRASNVTDSGITSFRIYDAGYMQLGANPVYVDAGGISGGLQLQIDASASSTAKPNVWIERNITANYVSGTNYVPAAIGSVIHKTSGSAYVHGIYCEAYLDGGTNSLVAVGGWARGSTSGSSNRYLFGGWFRAESSSTQQCIGAEFNVGNASDPGHGDAVASNDVVGNVIKATGGAGTNATHGIYIATGDAGEKFHAGLTIGQNSIVPSDGSTINEGIYIIGGSSSGNRYYGIRLKDYLVYGIEMSDAICLYDIAMHFASGHLLAWGTGSAGQLGGKLYMDANGHLHWYNWKNSTDYALTP